MIWRVIQAIGGVLMAVGAIALWDGRPYWLQIVGAGLLVFIFSKVMRFITKDK